MNRTTHKITRVVFEIGLRGRERVTTLQNRISVFAGGAFEAVLIESLSALAGEDRFLALDRIELNIGNVSYQHLEEDLAAGIARCLREWAFRYLPPHRLQSVVPANTPKESDGASARGPHLLPGPDAPLSPVSIIASRGGLNAAVASALRGPGDWPQLLAAIRDNHAFRGRLAGEVSPQLLKGLLQELVPAHGAAMAEVAAVLIALHDHAPLAPADRQTFRRVVWECVLTGAARYHPASFSLESFVAGILKLLAARHSMPQSVLSSRIAGQLQHIAQRGPVSAVLAELAPEIRSAASHGSQWQSPELPGPVPALAAPAPEDELPSPRASRMLGDLARFLEWGVVPWSTSRATQYNAEAEMLQSLAASPDEVCALVRRLGEGPSVRKRIAGQFSEHAVHRLVATLDPVNAPWMLLCTRQLRRLHAQKPLFRMQNRAFAHLLWELMFEYLAARHWHALNAVSFLRFLLQRLAARQKTSYELVLADLTLRRSPDRRRGSAARETGPQSLLNASILMLLEEDVLGVSGRRTSTPSFVVQPEFQHLYSDLDVLAYWLRWRKLPSWSVALSPEETARHIGPLLGELPRDVHAGVRKTRAAAPSASSAHESGPPDDVPAPSIQIERWLLYGIWPAGVDQPRFMALTGWLERQEDSDWLAALRQCGAQEQVAQRIINHMPPAFLPRAAGVLSGPRAEAVCAFLRSLQAIGKHIAGSFSPPWREQVERYSLACLLKIAASPGHPMVSVEDLAYETIGALSLRCQISCDRVLLLLEREGQSQPHLQEVCRHLRERFSSHSSSGETMSEQAASVNGAASDAQEGSVPCLLHYLQYASLPENAASLDFSTLQQMAGRCDDRQLATLSQSLRPLIARPGGDAVARRTAALFPARAFLRLASAVSPGLNLAAGLDEIAGTANATGDFRALLEEMRRTEQFSGAVQASPAQPAPPQIELERPAAGPAGEDEARGQLDALAHLLRTGKLPWWNQNFAAASESWFRPLLESHTAALLKTLRSVSSAPRAVERLMRYLPPAELGELVRKAVPDYGGLIVLYIETSSELACDASLSASQRARATELHWHEALALLFAGELPGSAPAKALRALCRRVARQLGLSDPQYLQSMAGAARRRVPGNRACATLAEMLMKEQTAGEKHDGEPTGAAEEPTKDLRLESPSPAAQLAETENSGQPAENDSSAALHPAFPDETTMAGRLEHLLRYGALPPSASMEIGTLMEGLSVELTAHPQQYLSILRTAAGRDVERRRIARLFPVETIDRVWPVLLPRDHAQAASCLKELHEAAVLASRGAPEEQLQQTCVEELLRSAAQCHGRRWELAAYLKAAIERLVTGHSLRAAGIIQGLREKASGAAAFRAEADDAFGAALDRVERETAVLPVRPRPHASRPAEETRPAGRPWKQSTPFPAGEPFHIANAGAILLWPFLGRYFQDLGLLEKNAFPGEIERSRAVYLVQYLATGNIEAPENELLLNKILCGARPEQALEPVTPVTEAEESLSKELLRAVIANWSKLGNTSVEGLRQSFLVREGRLLRRDSDDAWNLTVSTRGYDVLLDSLPWRLSTVRQPWMQTVLHVKWR